MFSLMMKYDRWLTRVVGQIQILIHSGFRRCELIFRDLPSNNMFFSAIIHGLRKIIYYLMALSGSQEDERRLNGLLSC